MKIKAVINHIRVVQSSLEVQSQYVPYATKNQILQAPVKWRG